MEKERQIRLSIRPAARLRKAWADVTNRYLEQYGHDERIDRGLTEQPTIHECVVARELEKLKTEKEMLLRSLNCADDASISAVKKEIATMESALQKAV